MFWDPLVHIHQKKKIVPEIAAKIARVKRGLIRATNAIIFCPYNNNGLLTEREVCTVKYQTEVF
jgi:hypothetical protein